jgi:hypothetical protein
MNKSEALAIDKQHHLLPGGQGEHDFSVLWNADQMWEHLNNFAEMCGGLYQNGNPAVLHTCDDWIFLICFSPDKSRVVEVSQIHPGNRLTLYWDERRERPGNGYYQGRNADLPFLSDWELTDGELAVDQARIDRELVETPPPKPKPIDHDKIFRDELGLSQDEVRHPHLRFEIHGMSSAFDHSKNHLLHSEVTTLGGMKRIASREYAERSCYIFLPHANHPEEDGPQMGDAILRVRHPGEYMHNYSGIVTGSWTSKGKDNELQSACFNPSPFWNPLEALHGHGNPNCSGGPWNKIVRENCKLMGTRLQRFWYWGEGWAGPSCGVDYYCEVNVWHWVD